MRLGRLTRTLHSHP
ncbi:hypothetical protein E2C01_081673 [Portunus trituberculatus]|uniref:Uncharacterized protein n=1 Tax=Portunus trituberculatus TaxID=210409 RepID=A0A5B7IZH4_PORTR|nr:hypothetical protein [Portunus trituberculatus]